MTSISYFSPGVEKLFPGWEIEQEDQNSITIKMHDRRPSFSATKKLLEDIQTVFGESSEMSISAEGSGAYQDEGELWAVIKIEITGIERPDPAYLNKL